jgi:hypothetical protein
MFALRSCDHHAMYFEKGKLTCTQCGMDRTPLENMRVIVVFDDYREKVLKDIQKILDGMPEEVLKEVEEHVKYLKWKRNQERFLNWKSAKLDGA